MADLEKEVKLTYLPCMDQKAILFFNPHALPKDVVVLDARYSTAARFGLERRRAMDTTQVGWTRRGPRSWKRLAFIYMMT